MHCIIPARSQRVVLLTIIDSHHIPPDLLEIYVSLSHPHVHVYTAEEYGTSHISYLRILKLIKEYGHKHI